MASNDIWHSCSDDEFFSASDASDSSDCSFHSTSLSLHSQLDSTFSSFPKNFNAVHINAQSIPSHFPDLLSSFDNNKNLHAILVSETFLKPRLPSVSYSIPGFHLIRNDRTGKGGGGVAIYLRSHIPFTILDKSPTLYSESAEHIFIEVLFGQLKLLLGVYYSPSLHINYFQSFETLLEKYIPTVDHTIIMGDFNTCLLKADARAKRLTDIVNSSNLQLLPSPATHFFPNCTPSLLDLIMVSSTDHVNLHGQFPAEAFSYHDLIYVSYKIRPPKAKPTIVMRRSFKNFNNEKFLQDLHNIDWDAIYCASTVDDKVNLFNSMLTELFDVHAPLRPMKLKHLPAPWLTKEIKIAMAKRNSAKAKFKLNPTDERLIKYKKLRNQCSKLCRDAQRKYIHDSIENNNSLKTWKFLSSLGIGKQRNQTINNINIDALNKHFTSVTLMDLKTKDDTLTCIRASTTPDFPSFRFDSLTPNEVKKHILAIKSDAIGSDGISRKMILMALEKVTPILCHILNCSLFTSTFPNVWRSAYVIPVPKINNPSSFSHFRPISILPFLSKVAERIVSFQLRLYLSRNNLLNPFQSGFRPGHSTVTALTKICDDIRSGLDKQLVTIIVLLDFSNAFNTVDFDIMLAILKFHNNLSQEVVSWFHSYLQNRQQRVRVDGKFSSFSYLQAGVPQGGVLSPLLFAIFINSISHFLSCSFHLYADDLQIYVSVPADEIAVGISKINSDLCKISSWSKSNGLNINASKSQAIIVGNPKQTRKIDTSAVAPIVLDNTILPFSETVKNLGLIIDSSFSWVPQINQVSRRLFAAIGSLKRWKNLLPIRTKITLAETLLLPILDYADCSYTDLNVELLNKLERLQNMAIRFIFGLRKFDHISEYRARLKWLPIRMRRNFHVLTLLFSILYAPHTPSYLKDRFTFYSAVDCHMQLRSRSDNKLLTPHHHTTFYGKSFTVHAVILWNNLPKHVRDSKSLPIFKNRLKDFFLSASCHSY